MSNPFIDAVSGVAKGIMFVVHVLSHVQSIGAQLGKLSGPVIAAMLAVFYDIMKMLTSADAVTQNALSGNFLGAVTLSETTVGLLKQVAMDFHAGEQLVVNDWKVLQQIGTPTVAQAATAPATAQ